MISSCLLRLSEFAESKLETKFANKIGVSDGIWVMEEVVNTQRESVWVTSIILHSSTHRTTSLCIQIWCTLSTFLKFLMVGFGNRGEETGSGKGRKLDYTNEKLVYGSTCDKLSAEITDMWQHYVINRSQNMCISGSEIEMAQSFWM